MNAVAAKKGPDKELVDHDLARDVIVPGVIFERRPARCPGGTVLDGLFHAWITLDNPKQFNSYTTEMVKGVILAFRRASAMRDVVTVVFTGSGDKAFCSGGNTQEYAEYYAGNPQEYRQYMRLFNDMVSVILACDKPVICRVNGMRVGGGQEIGMACDFSVAQDLARFGQAGPKHGSAPIGGATDFLSLMIGAEQSMVSGILCELKVDGEFVPNPLVETQQYLDDWGRVIHGESKAGDALAEGKVLLKKGTVDLSLLDEATERLCAKFIHMFPDCLTKTLEELRKPKLNAWNANKENSRAWLALNMMTEGRAGFRAFNEPADGKREIDFIGLRQALAVGEPWTDELTTSLLPAARAGK